MERLRMMIGSSGAAGTTEIRLHRVTAVLAVALLLPGCSARHYQPLSCRKGGSALLLEAQAVPSATFVPCIQPLPVGWTFGGSDIRSGSVRFWLDSDRRGPRAAEGTLTRTCDVSAAIAVPVASDAIGLHRYEATPGRDGAATIYFRFTGGCLTYRVGFARASSPGLFDQADRALAFTPRADYVKSTRREAGLVVCGADAPPCPG
jgi:hypothetical protein